MPDTPLNPDALEKACKSIWESRGNYPRKWENANPETAIFLRSKVIKYVSAYLDVAQPEVNSFDPRVLNRKGWTCGCEPGNYDSCDECQSACNELANFLNRPEVNDA